MYIVVIAWLYVTVMMAVAEAAAPQGSWLGAVITLVLYGLLPLGILLYIMDTPQRKRRLRARQQHQAAEHLQAAPAAAHADTPSSGALAQPDASGHAPSATQHSSVAPVREKL